MDKKNKITGENKMKKNYTTCLKNGVYKVGYFGPCGDFHAIGDIREFKNFDDANQVCKEISNGKYGYESGNYINMR